MEEWPPIWRVLNKQSQTADKGWSSSLGVGQGANNFSLLKHILLRNIHKQSLGHGLVLWYNLINEGDMRFGTWKVRSLYRAGSCTAAARELARCKLEVVCVQVVRWEREGTVRAGDYNFF